MNQILRERVSAEAISATVAHLAATFGNRLVTSDAVCAQHGNTTTWIPCQPPDAVVFPQSTEDVQEVVRTCSRYHVPVIPFGTGTSFEGSVNAPLGGISIDFRDMNRLLAIHAEDFDCVVEPGITRTQVNNLVRDTGLFFPVDPGADASLGGMASTRASGTTAVRYGTMKDNVLALKAVMANGEVISTARRARKSSAGYDLTRLLIGAEGTLGVITELTLKLFDLPEAIAGGVCAFPSVASACDAAISGMQAGIPFARVELLDEVQVRACNEEAGLALAETPTLFLEFHGTEASVAEQATRFGEVAEALGGGEFRWATKPEERTRLWKARHHVFWANKSFRPGALAIVTDVCVPISRFAECVTATKADIEQSNLVAPIVGHAGDGNFHAVVLVMHDDAEEVSRARNFVNRLVERALAMEGTCTGEHAIGQGKRHFLEAEHGRTTVDVMRSIKQALDPSGIMNPEKILE